MRHSLGTSLTAADAAALAPPRSGGVAGAVLTGSAVFWFVVIVVGQWLFLYYIAAFYGASVLDGDFSQWTRNKLLFKGYVAGDTIGNVAFAAHALLAGYMAIGGLVQLVPQVRKYAPSFHRWNGRTYIVTALLLSASGFYMVWWRGAFASMHGAIAVSLNGVLIVLFALLAWRYAMKRDFTTHRRWALRTFLVSNGQWFIRIGVIAWVAINNGLGLAKGFNGPLILPFVIFWEFGCFLVPLAMLELYLRAKEKSGARRKYAVAGALVVLTLLMAGGIFGLTMFLSSIMAKA
jgi:hypothetical protein